MQTETNYTGIDISKSFFDVAVARGADYRYYKFSNDEAGFNSLVKELPLQTHVVMEASGPYYLRLACFLSAQGVKVSVVNPLVIRRFSQMRMSRAKTDKKDARMIAGYGITEQPALWEPPQQHIITLQHLTALVTGLKQEHTALSNQLGSFEAGGMLDKQTRSVIIKELAHKETMMQKLIKQMEQIAETLC